MLISSKALVLAICDQRTISGVSDDYIMSHRYRAEHELFSRIQELTEDRISLYFSHRFSTARIADRIFVLEHGCLIERGTYADLFELQAASYR